VTQSSEDYFVSLWIIDLLSSTLARLVKLRFITAKHTSVRASIPKNAILAPSLA
jgi:hypothetical protein